MGELGLSDDFKQWHAGSVVVNKSFVAFIDSFGSILLHLDAINQDVVLLITIVKEKKTAIFHNWVVFLSDLVGLRQIGIAVVLSIEFYQRQNATTETKRSFNSEIKAFFV
jgi:hypothetical protein